MHYFGDYIYDANRLIFYKKDMPQHIVNAIQITDNYNELKHTLDKLDKNNMSAKDKPIELIGICLTYNCQLRCNYCSYSSTDGNCDELTSDDVVTFVIEAIKKRKIYEKANGIAAEKPLRFFFTGGGEPTYNWNLFKETVCAIEKKCQQYSVPYYFELTTNGMLNDFQRLFIKEHFNKVMLSYDGMPDIQNKNRRCSNSKKTSDVVEETIRVFSNSNLYFTVRTTIWHDDFSMMREMCDYLVMNFNGINEWSIMPIIPSGRALINSDSEQYSVDKSNFFNYYLDLIKYSKSKQYNLYISTAVFYNSTSEFCCGATFNECFWLMPDKSINNCIEAEKFKIDVGHVKNNKVIFLDKYVDSTLDIVRDTFQSCRNCLAYRFCKGACPLKIIRDEYYGTEYRDYECQMRIQYWRYIFNEVLSGKECFGWKAIPMNKDNLNGYEVLKLVNVAEVKDNENKQ